MRGRRPKNSELRLSRLEQEDALVETPPGILEIFDREPAEPGDADAPLVRESEDEPPATP